MTPTTAPDAVWQDQANTSPAATGSDELSAASRRLPEVEVDPDNVERIAVGGDLRPDPGARTRMASLLLAATGWDIFPEASPDRVYVSRLWAEDWNSPEDAIYDEE